MDTKKIILAGAIAAGAYLFLNSRNARAATAPTGATGPKRGNLPPRMTMSPDRLAAMMGVSFPVAPWSVQTIAYKPGQAIGNYSGMTQQAALEQAVTDYNNQFLSPYSTGYGVAK